MLSYYELSRAEGATVVASGGASSLSGPWSGGVFVEPTIWADVPAGSRLHSEEIFGPACSIVPFDTEEEAVALANDSVYDLSATVWTSDGPRTNPSVPTSSETAFSW